MSDHLRNFRSWYSDILQELKRKENAGLAMLMIASPLLERYLREKSGAREDNHLPESFFEELRKMFPALANNAIARNFWSLLRDGLLHPVALSEKPSRPNVAWSDNGEILKVDATAGKFELSPTRFVGKVIETIEADFETFEGKNSPHASRPSIHVSNGGVNRETSEAPGANAVSSAGMRIILSASSHSLTNPWKIPYPKELGVLMMVFALLTALVAHVGLRIPMILQITRIFEAPDENIAYNSSALHWLFIVEILLFALGLGLLFYGLFRRPDSAASVAVRERRVDKNVGTRF